MRAGSIAGHAERSRVRMWFGARRTYLTRRLELATTLLLVQRWPRQGLEAYAWDDEAHIAHTAWGAPSGHHRPLGVQMPSTAVLAVQGTCLQLFACYRLLTLVAVERFLFMAELHSSSAVVRAILHCAAGRTASAKPHSLSRCFHMSPREAAFL
mmetsp:Transcript_329/g.1021  ORF Transcript_329/g.1021 Transcript_329/m.1021 type:complete len:154 (+) Transcript_329:926-1387(+)|eukprot:scaffold110416_cov29-Tisochrysis_lutea.AAC.1